MTDYQKLQSSSFVPLSRGWGLNVEQEEVVGSLFFRVTLTYQGEGQTYGFGSTMAAAVLRLCTHTVDIAPAMPPTWSFPFDEIAALGVDALGEWSAKGKDA